MASPQKPATKTTSRWNFLSQAVASVESRLDNILAEDEVPSRKPTPQPVVHKESPPPSRASMESPRGSGPTNDRLQERLARAMAKKNLPKVESPAASETVSRTSTSSVATLPTAGDAQVEQTVDPDTEIPIPNGTISDPAQVHSLSEKKGGLDASESESLTQRISRDIVRASQENEQSPAPTQDADMVLLQTQLEHENVKAKMQDEIQEYIERIDALNAKLQYLTKEAASSAKQHATEAPSGSLEKKLHEKDEKIALLMEEGQKLSMTEMKHLTTIKKLRAQVNTNSKDHDSVRQRADRAERTVSALDEKVKKAEASARSLEAKLAEASKKSLDVEVMMKEKTALNETLVEMRAQVAKANARAESAESNIRKEQSESEKKRIAELQDDISSAKVEREIAEGKFRQEIKDLNSSLQTEKEHSRMMETEMLAEQAALESRLESFRVRAEEATSNDHGDAQAKLLRQIETLQSQYAAASQNWQGVEGALLARITALEKEREELSAREADLRRKLKDATSKLKRNDKELGDLQLQYATEQETQSSVVAENQRLGRKVQHLEEECAKAQKDIEDQRTRMERDFARRLDEEKSRWAASVQLARTTSPTASTKKGSMHDLNHLVNPYVERPASRRSSTMVSALTNADSDAPSRHYSTTSSRNMYSSAMPETPILVTSEDQDEYFAGIPATPVSPDHAPSRRGVGDLISTSTVGAGPSVQLVERMSANVRRLESEKAASKDELARLTTQRDESRQEMVRLMREVEQKRKTEERLQQLEEEHKVLGERYQTTLELLGEKSEQVEELKADILDVKQMYRDLADHMK